MAGIERCYDRAGHDSQLPAEGGSEEEGRCTLGKMPRGSGKEAGPQGIAVSRWSGWSWLGKRHEETKSSSVFQRPGLEGR